MKHTKWERRETELDSGIHPSAPRKHTKLISYMYGDATVCTLQRPLCWSRVHNKDNSKVQSVDAFISHNDKKTLRLVP